MVRRCAGGLALFGLLAWGQAAQAGFRIRGNRQKVQQSNAVVPTVEKSRLDQVPTGKVVTPDKSGSGHSFYYNRNGAQGSVLEVLPPKNKPRSEPEKAIAEEEEDTSSTASLPKEETTGGTLSVAEFHAKLQAAMAEDNIVGLADEAKKVVVGEEAERNQLAADLNTVLERAEKRMKHLRNVSSESETAAALAGKLGTDQKLKAEKIAREAAEKYLKRAKGHVGAGKMAFGAALADMELAMKVIEPFPALHPWGAEKFNDLAGRMFGKRDNWLKRRILGRPDYVRAETMHTAFDKGQEIVRDEQQKLSKKMKQKGPHREKDPKSPGALKRRIKENLQRAKMTIASKSHWDDAARHLVESKEAMVELDKLGKKVPGNFKKQLEKLRKRVKQEYAYWLERHPKDHFEEELSHDKFFVGYGSQGYGVQGGGGGP